MSLKSASVWSIPAGTIHSDAVIVSPFSGRADQTLPLAERDPARHPYVVLEAGEPVAFLILDETPPAADPAARAVYVRGGFVDAGELHLGGSMGPQHVLRLHLDAGPAAP